MALLFVVGRWCWPLRLGAAQDAAVRQQERVPGRGRHARGHDARTTDAVARDLADYLRTVRRGDGLRGLSSAPASPMDFNGMVRHYYLRRGPNVADLRVNLVAKDEPRSSSPRDRAAAARRAGGDRPRIGRQHQDRRGAARPAGARHARRPKSTATPDADYAELQARRRPWPRDCAASRAWWTWTTRSRPTQTQVVFVTDKEKAALTGIATEDIAQTLRLALGRRCAGARCTLPARSTRCRSSCACRATRARSRLRDLI